MTEVLRIDPVDPDPASIARAADILRRGGLVAFPTETVYGLGVHALDRDAVRRLFAAKRRPPHDPLIVHVSSLNEAIGLIAEVPEAARVLAARFWPGPLTVVMSRSPAVPDEVTAGLETVAIRVPAHPVARALLAGAGLPIAAPSANLFSRPSPTCAEHVLEDLDGRIDMVIDAGPTQVGVESTVVDLSTEVPTVLRPGAVTLDMLRAVLPHVELRTLSSTAGAAMPSPGMLSKHYAPRTPLTLYTGHQERAWQRLVTDARGWTAQGRTIVVLAPRENIETMRSEGRGGVSGVHFVELGSRSDPSSLAPRLYAALRECDALGQDMIFAMWRVTSDGLGPAIHDRLYRAAAQVILIE